ncbi:MAG: LysE family translocator [Pseudomonadota bacterium]
MPLNFTIGPLVLFTLVAAITPGPNNLLLMRSGARFGVRRSTSHMLGIQVGFFGLLVMSHLGVGTLLRALPFAMQLLRWGCFGYLLWLAYAILHDARSETAAAKRPIAMEQSARPMTLIEAMLFQLVNPKAWMMTITVVSGFYGDKTPTWLDLAVIALICVSIGTTSMLIWNIWGAAINSLLTQPRARQIFGYSMAALVVATAIWMLR